MVTHRYILLLLHTVQPTFTLTFGIAFGVRALVVGGKRLASDLNKIRSRTKLLCNEGAGRRERRLADARRVGAGASL